MPAFGPTYSLSVLTSFMNGPQVWGMFVGETACMVAYLALRWCQRIRGDDKPEQGKEEEVRQRGSFNPLIFWPPALCDGMAFSLQYIAINLTYLGSLQMLKGAGALLS